MFALYHEFSNYVLTEDQLRSNGFPEESPLNPGKIVVRNPNLAKNSTERRCVRCSTTFHIQSDGTYRADETCRYHARKQQPYRRGHPYRGEYPCCNGNYMSEGCVTCQYHVTTESVLHKVEFVKTKSKRHLNKVTSCSVYGLDCEMLYTTAGMEVAKVGVVSAEGLTVFESFVLPQNQILDYNTIYSGITEKDLKGVTMTLNDVQAFLLKLLNEDSILVGHGLENDLRALRLIHLKVVDTSVVFPHEHTRYKKSLKSLADEVLNKQIQTSSNGHNCIEDARTCMELMLHKIDSDLVDRPPVTQDENKNSILQNTFPSSQAVAFTAPKYSVYEPWPYSDYSYCGNSYRGNSFYSGFLMPKNYQNSCIY